MQFKRKTNDGCGELQSAENLVARQGLQHTSSGPRAKDCLPSRAVLDAAMRIVGSLEARGEIQVDAKIEGDVRCKQLIVGKDGSILGNIAADEVIVRGEVKGAIRASRVIVRNGARVESDINHDTLTIEEGAFFKGASTPNEQRKIEAPDSDTVVTLQAVGEDLKPAA